MKMKLLMGLINFGCLIYFGYLLSDRWDETIGAIRLYFGKGWLLAIVICLLIVKEAIEAYRWQVLREGTGDKSSYIKSLATVLKAEAYGNATPGGIGEHAGRVVGEEDKKHVIVRSLLASVIQTCSIFVLGLTAALHLWLNGHIVSGSIIIVTCMILIIGVAVFAIVSHFKRGLIIEIMRDMTSLKVKKIVWAFLLNMAKVMTFSLQMALLIAYGETPSATLLAYVLFFYLALTVVPTLRLWDIGVRGSLSIYILGNVAEEGAVIAASVMIWLINVIVPSVIGLIVLQVSQFRRGV